MERTKIYKALQGVRGRKPVNMAALETFLVQFSQLVVDRPDIREIDVNPLLSTPDKLIALDARVLLAPQNQSESERPRLAIHPYPNQLTTTWKTSDGTAVTIRVIRPEDEPLLSQLFDSFSERTIRLRFFSMLKRLTHDNLVRLCHLDYDREMALAAVRHFEQGPRFLGVSRYYLHMESGAAEYAIAVADMYQGLGLGRHLMQRLIAVAKQRGVRRLIGPVLRENTGMLNLAKDLGFQIRDTATPEVVETVLELPGQ
jgi:acetyltransferase